MKDDDDDGAKASVDAMEATIRRAVRKFIFVGYSSWVGGLLLYYDPGQLPLVWHPPNSFKVYDILILSSDVGPALRLLEVECDEVDAKKWERFLHSLFSFTISCSQHACSPCPALASCLLFLVMVLSLKLFLLIHRLLSLKSSVGCLVEGLLHSRMSSRICDTCNNWHSFHDRDLNTVYLKHTIHKFGLDSKVRQYTTITRLKARWVLYMHADHQG